MAALKGHSTAIQSNTSSSEYATFVARSSEDTNQGPDISSKAGEKSDDQLDVAADSLVQMSEDQTQEPEPPTTQSQVIIEVTEAISDTPAAVLEDQPLATGFNDNLDLAQMETVPAVTQGEIQIQVSQVQSLTTDIDTLAQGEPPVQTCQIQLHTNDIGATTQGEVQRVGHLETIQEEPEDEADDTVTAITLESDQPDVFMPSPIDISSPDSPTQQIQAEVSLHRVFATIFSSLPPVPQLEKPTSSSPRAAQALASAPEVTRDSSEPVPTAPPPPAPENLREELQADIQTLRAEIQQHSQVLTTELKAVFESRMTAMEQKFDDRLAGLEALVERTCRRLCAEVAAIDSFTLVRHKPREAAQNAPEDEEEPAPRT